MQQGAEQKAAVAQAKLADSAGRLEDSAIVQEDSADRRTELAADRTVLAAERTYAAWMRTGLAALAAGLGAQPLLDDLVPRWLILATTLALLVFAEFCWVAAVWRQLDRGAPPPRPDLRTLPTWVLLVFNAFLFAVGLAIVVGVIVR
jgi:putative membrane protein